MRNVIRNNKYLNNFFFVIFFLRIRNAQRQLRLKPQSDKYKQKQYPNDKRISVFSVFFVKFKNNLLNTLHDMFPNIYIMI